MDIKISLDKTAFQCKPTSSQTAFMKKRLPEEEDYYDIKTIAECIGNHGHSFLPATFNGMASKQENFEQCQLFGLDFDNEPDYEKIKQKLKKYHLPIVFSYHTFSSTPEHPKYRIILCHIVPITERWLADMILKMLKKMFPEADKLCFETARLFYGGKGLIDFNNVVEETGENTFNVYNLVQSFEKFLHEDDRKNFARNIKTFARRYGIGLSDNHFNIFFKGNPAYIITREGVTSPSYYKNDDLIGNNIKYELYIPNMSSKIIFYEFSEEQKEKEGLKIYVDKNEKPKKIEKVAENKICSLCRLWREFTNGTGERLNHDDKFLLATNIRFITGYQKRFFDALKKHYPDSNLYDWRKHFHFMEENNYKPQRCEVCKYSNTCNHGYTLLETLRKKKLIFRTKNYDFVSIDESVKQVSHALKTALKNTKNRIHLIPGQTGIGKTTLYINLIKSSRFKKPLLIAVPTSNLKNELKEKIGKDKVLDIPALNDLMLEPATKQTLKKYYEEGNFDEAREAIAEICMELEASIDDEFFLSGATERPSDAFNKYLHPEDYLEKTSKCVIMTHARFLSLPTKLLKKFEIIIDEDILYNSMLTRVGSVKISTLENVLKESRLSYEARLEIENLLDLQEGKCYKKETYGRIELDIETIEKCKANDNLTEFLKAGCYMRQKDCIKYLPPIKLPKCKLIILSATLDSVIYELFFPTREFIFHEVKQAAYMGNVIQYPAYSMSRNTIKNIIKSNDLSYSTPTMLFKKILSYTYNVTYGITFKKYEKDLQLKNTLHFGNLAGTDCYSGKNGVIIGTPHFPTYLYELIACTIDISESSTNSYKNRRVNYKGDRFRMMSYKNEILQRIQFYLISSELEQAVGRSRLLRTNSTVFVFSNFPCEQADFCEFDYLKNADVQKQDTDQRL